MPVVGVVTIAAMVVYRRAVSGFFFDDDFQWLVSSWSFTPSQLLAFGSMQHFYRPVVVLYFAAAVRLFGRSPIAFHVANLLLHVATGLLVLAAARLVGRMTSLRGGSELQFGFLAALFFVIQPSDVDTIAWVGALAEALGACLGLASLLAFLEWRQTSRRGWRAISILAFALSLLTHESSIMFLPIIGLADFIFAAKVAGAVDPNGSRRSASMVAAFGPYLIVGALYLAIDIPINSRNYLIGEGHYTLGLHIVRNAVANIRALYVGRPDMVNNTAIIVGIGWLLAAGGPRVRFSVSWTLLALAPFLPFTWGNPTRYLYHPAIGFSLMLAQGVLLIDRALAARVRDGVRHAIVAGVVSALALRFMIFASANVASFVRHTDEYRAALARLRHVHPTLPSHAVVPTDQWLTTRVAYRFMNAAVQWEYGDPTIELEPYNDPP